MTAMFLPEAALLAVRLVDEAPEPEDVKAGWTAFVIFLLLIGAVVVLSFSLVKQLRKAQAAKDAGVYDTDDDTGNDTDKDAAGAPTGTDSESEPHQTP